MNFVRTLAGLRNGCRLGPRTTFNEISSFIDAGTVYSNDPHLVEKLRSFKAGQLKVGASEPTIPLLILYILPKLLNAEFLKALAVALASALAEFAVHRN